MTVLVLTVGTSLLHSASWEPQGALARISGYELWAQEPYVESPQRRASMCAGGSSGRDLAARIEELLRQTPPGDESLPVSREGSSRPGRYPAEITTLLQLHQKERPRLSFGDYLARYEDIRIVSSAVSADPSHLAAGHVQAILETLAGRGRCSRLCWLEGSGLAERLGSFENHLRGLQARAEVDLVVSGGYKAFATMAGRHLTRERPRWRTVYLHEEALQPILEDSAGLVVDGRRIEIPPGEANL